MTAAGRQSDGSSFHQPLLPDTHPPQYIIVLPPRLPYFRRPRSCQLPVPCCATILLFLFAPVFLLWPSDPQLSIVRLSLDHLHFRTLPKISVDVTLVVTVKIRNRDFYSIDYDSLLVSIGYRGERLGFMTSGGGHIKARGSSNLNATLLLDGVEVLNDAILLIQDLAKGAIPLDTVSEITGKLGLFFFAVPLKTKISCEVLVNTHNQTIAHQNCYPQV